MAESDPPSSGSEAAGLLSGGSYQVAFKEGGHSKKKRVKFDWLFASRYCMRCCRWNRHTAMNLSRVVSVAHILRRLFDSKMFQ